jgi:hypothetical protein
MMNPSRIGFSPSPFVPNRVKNRASPNNLRTNIDLERSCSARLQAGIVGASPRSPKGERYKAEPNCHPNGGAR